MGLKHKVGTYLIPALPVSRHVFDHLRLEWNAAFVRGLHRWHPGYRRSIRQLRRRTGVKLNVGSGPFGLDDWVNLDLFAHRNVTLRSDCRRNFPLGDSSCIGIHVEHYFEHLTHEEEAAPFLRECHRCLEAGGTLRIVVPDAERFVRAYADESWGALQALAAEGTSMKDAFATRMQALNHVMLQGFEHCGGYDFETLSFVLSAAGFVDVRRCKFGNGMFPERCIDREQHRPYSLYVEATK